MKIRPFATPALLLTLSAAACQGAMMIVPDSIHEVSSFFSPEYQPENAINGSGLPGNYSVSDSHAAYSNLNGGNHWTSAAGTQPLDQFITFAFDTPQDIMEFYLWNHQSNGGVATNPGYDVTLFDLVFYAADGTTVLLTLNDLVALPDSAAAQVYAFDLVEGVSFVRFDVEGVQSSQDYTGLAEVAFGVVPEPGLAALLPLSLAGLALRRTRR